MLQPKRLKHRKAHRGRRTGTASRGTEVLYGEVGLKTMESQWLTARQIEAARRAITHELRRGGQLWIRVFPDRPVTARPAETRMGGGKGEVDHYVALVKPGRVLFEVGGVEVTQAREALRLAAHKLPMGTRIVVRGEEPGAGEHAA